MSKLTKIEICLCCYNMSEMTERPTGEQKDVKKHIVRNVTILVLLISAAFEAVKWYSELPNAQQRELFGDLFGQAVPDKQSATDSIVPLS